MSESLEDIFAQQERDRLMRARTALFNVIRGAIVQIEDGDDEGAIFTLKQIIGEDT